MMFDELAIRKQVQWNGKQNVGFVNMGTGIDDDSLPLATEVLMFLVTPLNSAWKITIAYFLTDGLSMDVKANLVKEAIIHLHDANIRVAAIVCDGPSTNFSVGVKLGADLSVVNMKPYFSHPCNDTWNVYLVFDAAHMLKLMHILTSLHSTFIIYYIIHSIMYYNTYIIVLYMYNTYNV